MNCDYSFDDVEIDVNEWDAFTGENEWNAVYTVQLGKLVDCGVFDWTMPLLDWKDAAYDEEQYNRVCAYFIERFYYREISLEPFEEWARTLRRKMVYEVMPKYIPLYKRIEDGIDPLASGNRYKKSRRIGSEYPETLLSENSDYITDGTDTEEQEITENDFVDQNVKYAAQYHGVDELMLDEFESMFVSLYTMNVNATW